MNTLDHWFRSGGRELLAHFDLPVGHASHPAGSGVLIVPPFGWEDACSYRPLRFLAQVLAIEGIPAMRFDLPGTGDSSGNAHDDDLVEAWVESIGAAARELRRLTGVRDVTLLGVRSGALLSLAAAGSDADLGDLILWSAPASGKAMVRELRAFSKLARLEYSTEDAPPETAGGLEAGGFLVSPETRRALENLALRPLQREPKRRALILTANEKGAPDELLAVLRTSDCGIEIRDGREYASMVAIPEEASLPQEACRIISDFVHRTPAPAPDAPRVSPAFRTSAQIESEDGPVCETVWRIHDGSKSAFGVLTAPFKNYSSAGSCVLFLNPGAVRHVGPNRMWVQAARQLAARGIPSLRLDLEGIGESGGQMNRDVPSLYDESLVEQVEWAMDSLRAELGVRQFAAAGLCSGAFWAFHAAVRNPDIRAAILLNPRLFFWDPDVDRRRLLRRTSRLLTESTDWSRLLRGGVSVSALKRLSSSVLGGMLGRPREAAFQGPSQIPKDALETALDSLDRFETRVVLAFTEGEPLLRELEEEGHLPAFQTGARECIRLANCGHTFRPLWSQRFVLDLIRKEFDVLAPETMHKEFTSVLS